MTKIITTIQEVNNCLECPYQKFSNTDMSIDYDKDGYDCIKLNKKIILFKEFKAKGEFPQIPLWCPLDNKKTEYRVTFETSDGRKETCIVHKVLYDEIYDFTHKQD